MTAKQSSPTATNDQLARVNNTELRRVERDRLVTVGRVDAADILRDSIPEVLLLDRLFDPFALVRLGLSGFVPVLATEGGSVADSEFIKLALHRDMHAHRVTDLAAQREGIAPHLERLLEAVGEVFVLGTKPNSVRRAVPIVWHSRREGIDTEKLATLIRNLRPQQEVAA